MRIGIDIDGVLTNIEQFLADYATKFNYENNIKNNITPTYYNEYKTFGWTKEQGNKFWNEYLKYYVLNVKPRMFAKEVIDILKNKNEIYIITSRNEEGLKEEDIGKMQEFTKKWLTDNEIYYDKLVFSGENKLEYCKNNNISLLIEDKGENVEKVATIIPVLCMNALYNMSSKGKNIIRVYGWYDVLEKIDKLNKQGVK